MERSADGNTFFHYRLSLQFLRLGSLPVGHEPNSSETRVFPFRGSGCCASFCPFRDVLCQTVWWISTFDNRVFLFPNTDAQHTLTHRAPDQSSAAIAGCRRTALTFSLRWFMTVFIIPIEDCFSYHSPRLQIWLLLFLLLISLNSTFLFILPSSVIYLPLLRWLMLSSLEVNGNKRHNYIYKDPEHNSFFRRVPGFILFFRRDLISRFVTVFFFDLI